MRRRNSLILLIIRLGIALPIILSYAYFHFSAWDVDVGSYFFQAKLFCSGRLYVAAPPDYGLSGSPHDNILGGKWYSRYPFGNALMLAIGMPIGAPWLMPAILTGLSLYLLYLITEEAYGRRIGLIAAMIGLISPLTPIIGASMMSEAVNRFFVALFILALLRTLGRSNKWYPLIAGLSLGYAYNTRPLNAVVFGVCGLLFCVYSRMNFTWESFLGKEGASGIVFRFYSRRKSTPRRSYTSILIFLAPLAIMLCLTGLYNWHLTGNPLHFTHNAANPYDRLGFGLRGDGWFVGEPRSYHLFTPREAGWRIVRNILPCITHYMSGWGYFLPNMYSDEPLRAVIFNALPGGLLIGLMLSPFFCHRCNKYDFLFISFIIVNMIAHFFHWGDQSVVNPHPTSARYYAECVFLGALPLLARGITLFHSAMVNYLATKKPACRTFLKALVAVIIASLSANTIYTYIRSSYHYRTSEDARLRLLPPLLIAQQKIHHAVVFLTKTRDAPMGEYPFIPLGKADIVYFKLGPDKKYGLLETDWRKVYRKYFSGRAAYRFELTDGNPGGRLVQLDTTDV